MSFSRRAPVTSLEGLGDEYVLNPKEIGAILDLHPSTVADMCARGIIAGAFRGGNRWRLQAGDLRKHIKRNRVPWDADLRDRTAS